MEIIPYLAVKYKKMEIGQWVVWVVGSSKRKGLFMRYEGELARVMCREIDGVPHALQTLVPIKILQNATD